jgi:hypothetical protein
MVSSGAGSRASRGVLLAALSLLLVGAATPQPYGLPLKGEEAESFLRSAQVVKKKGNPVGITHSYKVTLTDGSQTLKAAWKIVDEYKAGITEFQTGGFEVDFRDSWKYEIAAYELDKLLGLDLVPPTVERTIDGQSGALQLWVEGCMTEADRKKNNVKVADNESWNEQIYKVRLIHQLTYNTDYTNIRNILIDPSFRVYAIDFSRAFRVHEQLLAEKDLVRFSREGLERLRALDRPVLEEKMGRWLRPAEINGLLKRRARILALAEQRVAERGEAKVLY